jgi:hypothetical protein
VRGLWVSRRNSKQQKARLGYVLGTLASFGTFWTLNVGDLIVSKKPWDLEFPSMEVTIDKSMLFLLLVYR